MATASAWYRALVLGLLGAANPGNVKIGQRMRPQVQCLGQRT